jgi:hypothetical protein
VRDCANVVGAAEPQIIAAAIAAMSRPARLLNGCCLMDEAPSIADPAF